MYLSSVYFAKNASATCSKMIDFAKRLLSFSMATFTMKGLFEGAADLRDLTQYKYAKQTTIAKTFQHYLQVN